MYKNVFLVDRKEESESPKFLCPMPNVYSKEGESATFTVQVIGEPLQLTWFREKTKIEPDGVDFQVTPLENDKASLTLTYVVQQDSGVITCVAKNTSGVSSCSAELFVSR